MTGRAGRAGYPGYSLGPYEHLMVTDNPAPRESAAAMTAKVKAAVTEVRAIEARRRADAVAAEVAALSARVTELEHPAPTSPEQTEPRRDHTIENTDRVAVSGADAEWLVGRWRDNGWRE